MKTLSIRRPNIDAILYNLKDIELRSWYTHYRGPILLHAAKATDSEALRLAPDIITRAKIDRDRMISGALVGKANLSGVKVYGEGMDYMGGMLDFIDDTRRHLAPWRLPNTFPYYGFELTDVAFLDEPIPWPGQVGLFNVPDHVVTEVIEQVVA